VSLTLAILEIVYCGVRVILQLLHSQIAAAQRGIMPKTPGMSPAFYAEAEALARRIEPWEIARTVPFVVASVVLLFIARRLRAGDAGALSAARQWALAAFGVVCVSLLVQVVAIVPPTLAYMTRVVELMPAPARTKAPFDVGAMMSSMTTFGVVMGLAMGTVFMSAWPIALYVWAGSLRRSASAS
jgi:hypothetical protein